MRPYEADANVTHKAHKVHCAICAAASGASGSSAHANALSTAYVDEDFIVFIEPDRAGALVAPRQHIGALSVDPNVAGHVLGGLRQAALAVRGFYGVTGATVEPSTEAPGSPDHVCYRVSPTLPAGVPSSGVQGERLMSVLRDRLEPATSGPRQRHASSRGI